MDKEQIAEKLNGVQYRDEDNVLHNIDTSKVLIVFGASDDLMELRGFINDEISCYNGGTAFITSDLGLLEPCGEECPYYLKVKKEAHTIEAIWDEDDYSWIYKTSLPHVTFDIMDDDIKYCRGIVIDIEDIK